ncbi:MAG: hypothetical protein QOE70_766 [Chthoniobacter sp.]|jgi:hypothetical protein|nr:hypothetical protein [Chthoniobacter sp.]
MKPRSLLLLLLLAATLTVAAPRPARALDVSFDFFHDSLAPFGEWIEVGDYGPCWRPTGVDEDWAPYSDGYWTYTDAGWTWLSYEDFGGIVYHYGRWVKIDDEGWCWVPDYEWGPAWVSWRHSDDYVGWAPLPAEARWERDRGFSVVVDTQYDIAPSYYNFCHNYDFGAPVLRAVILRRTENVIFINRTINITNISYNTRSNCVFNGGLDYAVINRFARRPIPTLKLVQNNNITVVNNRIVNNVVNNNVVNFNPVQRGNQLMVVAPRVIRPERAQLATLLKSKETRVIPQEKVTKGWNTVSAEQRTTIRAKFQQEAKGLTAETARARPVKDDDLKVVPVKGDPDAPMPVTTRNARVPRSVPGTRGAEKIAREKAAAETTTEPVNPPVTTSPVDPRDPAKIAREKALDKKGGRKATPGATESVKPEADPSTVGVPPGNPPAVARERSKPGRPELTKPFNPAKENPPVDDTPRTTRTLPPDNDAVTKRNAAQDAGEAAQKQNAAREAARQRALERQEAVDAAVERKRMLQQQQPPEAPVARQRQVEPPQDTARKQALEAAQERQRQSQQLQEQAVVRQRANEAAEQRQRLLEQQQQQAVRQRQVDKVPQQDVARERAQQAANARQQMLQQQQQQAAEAQAQAAARQKAPQVQRNVPVQRVAPQPQPQGNVPVQKGGKRKLTPEEQAALEKAR